MSNEFVVSDWHFNHANILNFKGYDGEPVRSFSSVDEMNETMIERHNSVVKNQSDKVYFCGDVYFHATKKSGPLADISTLLARLNGTLILIAGNHDDTKDPVLQKYFTRHHTWRMRPELGILLSHFPLHPSNMRRGAEDGQYLANIHGHIHQNDSPIDDKVKYVNVCVEKTDYYPLHMDEVLARVKA